MHPLHEVLIAAAAGRFPPVDGIVEVHLPAPGGVHVIAEFTGHALVLTDRDPAALLALGIDGFGGVAQPDVVRWLAGPTGLVGSHDVVLVAGGRLGRRGGEVLPMTTVFDDHPRVRRAQEYRRDVRVHGDQRGFVTLGKGLVDRLEMSVELTESADSIGTGRELIGCGLDLVNRGELVWAQVAPGNAASLRAFLSCGFTPIGAETIIVPDRSEETVRPMSELRDDQSID